MGGGEARTPFANNIIDPQRLNAVGLAIAATYVKPQTVSAFYGAPNLTQAATLSARASQKTAKLDHNITNKLACESELLALLFAGAGQYLVSHGLVAGSMAAGSEGGCHSAQ